MKQIRLGALSLHFSGYQSNEANIPEVGERLRVRGLEGWHLIVELDEIKRTCTVVSAGWPEDVQTNVPWRDLQRVSCFEAFSVKLMETE